MGSIEIVSFLISLEHEYISQPFDAGQPVRFIALKAKSETAGRSSIAFSVRMAHTKEGLSRALCKGVKTSQGRARWLQYQAVFQTPNLADAPNLCEVDVSHAP